MMGSFPSDTERREPSFCNWFINSNSMTSRSESTALHDGAPILY
jgi:hypothetical protein